MSRRTAVEIIFEGKVPWVVTADDGDKHGEAVKLSRGGPVSGCHRADSSSVLSTGLGCQTNKCPVLVYFSWSLTRLCPCGYRHSSLCKKRRYIFHSSPTVWPKSWYILWQSLIYCYLWPFRETSNETDKVVRSINIFCKAGLCLQTCPSSFSPLVSRNFLGRSTTKIQQSSAVYKHLLIPVGNYGSHFIQGKPLKPI